ncbi:hypothetical protein DFH28DRAFT_924333 [Melampsora americana]|nr:hypothetical protein DFH28DRAFT_924333 [Melampsora americana]
MTLHIFLINLKLCSKPVFYTSCLHHGAIVEPKAGLKSGRVQKPVKRWPRVKVLARSWRSRETGCFLAKTSVFGQKKAGLLAGRYGGKSISLMAVKRWPKTKLSASFSNVQKAGLETVRQTAKSSVSVFDGQTPWPWNPSIIN